MTDYGRDLSCTDTLYSGRTVSGVRLVAEAVYRRLITRKGELFYDIDYGFHVGDELGATTSPAERAALPGKIANEIRKDERVQSVDVDVTETGDTSALSWSIDVRAFTADGPFALVLAVSGVTVELLEIEA
jgi:hypothetical protein